MIQTSRYCYLEKRFEKAWVLGMEERYSDLPWMRSASIRAKVLDTYGESLAMITEGSIDLRPNLSDKELQAMFFGDSPLWELHTAEIDINNSYASMDLFYRIDSPDAKDGAYSRIDDTNFIIVSLDENVSMLFEVDRQDASPIERYLIDFKKTPLLKPYCSRSNDDVMSQYLYHVAIIEYIGTRKVRKLELRSDNFGHQVEGDDFLCCYITEY